MIKIKLIPEWKLILRKAWSVKMLILAGVLSAAEAILPMFDDSLPKGIFATLTVVAVAGAFITRILAQDD